MIAIIATLTVLFISGMAFSSQSSDEMPEGFQRVLPRGAIPAISNPTFVTAEEAAIGGNSWVLGVFIDGKARAYSLNLLNHIEIVNDQFGEKQVAAVW